jgi:hypothetical protein
MLASGRRRPVNKNSPGFLLAAFIDPDGDHVAATKLAVDCQVEHREVASVAFDLEFSPYRPDVFGSQRWLRTGQLALVPGQRL